MSELSNVMILPGWGVGPLFALIAGYSKVASSSKRHEEGCM